MQYLKTLKDFIPHGVFVNIEKIKNSHCNYRNILVRITLCNYNTSTLAFIFNFS